MGLDNPRKQVPKELWTRSRQQPLGEVPGHSESKPQSQRESPGASEGSTAKALSHGPLLRHPEARSQGLKVMEL